LLIDAGADPNAVDANGCSALMWSAYSDYAETATTRVLLEAGARLDVVNKFGETALTWARRRGESAMVRFLLSKGAKDEPPPAAVIATADTMEPNRDESITKAISALQHGGPQFYKVSGCVSCHNQTLPMMVTGMARRQGRPVDEAIAAQTKKQTLSLLRPAKLPLMEMSDVVPDVPITAPYFLLGLVGDGCEPDELTDAVVISLAAKQYADGSWMPWGPRPPMEFSPITATALSVRALQIFMPPSLRGEMEKRVAVAREYLRSAAPRTTEEKAMRLLGLQASGAGPRELAAAAKALTAAQNANGGWAQLDGLQPDAYATGEALYALRLTGMAAATDSVYTRGAEYLLRTQQVDGSWRVVSRSFPFQPYHESGFPHGKDQWISSAGTSWATLALMLGNEPGMIARR
ncbi:MAG: ankyrin repeat domain-containing protein, partial [Acidobacteriaceae bacterium]|nr:ankyrin repeat domain-containing protein [Acidobacteriaceae bacterium]